MLWDAAMSLFEFIVSLYVVIAGLGITLLARSVGEIVESRSRVKLYWVHSCWLFFILLAHVHSWFNMWKYHDVASWTVGEFLLLLSVPTILYLASHVSVPEIPEDERERQYDMRKYYYERHRLLLALLGMSVLLNVVCDWLLDDQTIRSTLNMLRLAGLAALVIGIISRAPRVQVAVTLLIGALLLFGLGVVDNRIE
jgi:hypothetical protein